jgi:alpha-galactosidase
MPVGPSGPISYDERRRTWRLDANDTCYAMAYAGGALINLGFSTTSEGFEARSGTLGMPLEVEFTVDDVECRDRFELVAVEVTDGPVPALTLRLRETRYSLAVAISYDLYAELNLIARRQSITNEGESPVTITSLPSFVLRMPADDYILESLGGDWADECNFRSAPLLPGRSILNSETGRHFCHNPWFALKAPRGYTFGALSYSGNWAIAISRDVTGETTVMGGIADGSLPMVVAPGKTITSPEALLGFTPGDANAVSRALHAYQRRSLLLEPARQPPVVFDHFFAVNPSQPTEERLRQLAGDAARLGCEVFLLDAGWHTNQHAPADATWFEQRGDWIVNRRVFPEGPARLTTYVRSLGMRFGIWMEPETVLPSSAVLAEHPEWAHGRAGQQLVGRFGARVLNMGLREAQDWVFDRVARTIDAFAAGYLKWDFNTDLSDGFGGAKPGAIIDHVEGLYQVWDKIRQRYPDLLLENCSSGGGRLDGGAMRHSDLTAMTDIMAPTAALGIRFGSSHAYRPEACVNWFVYWPYHWHRPDEGNESHDATIDRRLVTIDGDLDFRVRVAMMGAMGISSPTELWTEVDAQRVGHHVQMYKDLRPLLCAGEWHRLTPDPDRDGRSGWAAMCVVGPGGTEAVLFAYRLSQGPPTMRLAIPGLGASAHYEVSDDDLGVLGTETGEVLGTLGTQCHLDNPYRSLLRRFKARGSLGKGPGTSRPQPVQEPLSHQ